VAVPLAFAAPCYVAPMLRRLGGRAVAFLAVGALAGGALAGAAVAQENDGVPAAPETITASGTVSAAGTGNVALFFDSDYVDTDPGGGGEAENLRETLTAQGFTVTTFTGITTAEWEAALAGVKTVVLPELEENTGLAGDMEPGALAALQAYIAAGGKLVTFSSENWEFLEAVFGLPGGSITGSGGCPCTITAAAAGTEFGGGPTALVGLDATTTVEVGTFPTGTINVYEDDETTGDAGVTKTAVTDGCVVYLGWDWFFEEGQDFPPWFDVLERAVDAPCVPAPPPEPEPEPEPAPTAAPAPAPAPVTAQVRFTG
jgi:hypothetical protein